MYIYIAYTFSNSQSCLIKKCTRLKSIHLVKNEWFKRQNITTGKVVENNKSYLHLPHLLHIIQ